MKLKIRYKTFSPLLHFLYIFHPIVFRKTGGKKQNLIMLLNIKLFPSVTGIQALSTITVQHKPHCNKVENMKKQLTK